MSDRWTIRRGDALAFLRDMPAASVDGIICDPPYSSGGAFRGDRMAGTRAKYLDSDARGGAPDFLGDTRDQRGWTVWASMWLADALRVVHPGGLLAMFVDWRQLPVATDALQVGGWVWRGVAAWDKTEAARPQQGRMRAQCEFVVWGSAGPLSHVTDHCAAGAWREYVPGRDRLHQTEKPIIALRDIVRLVPPGGLVLDPFCGSGSTGIAALLEGRRFLGFELSEHYAALADERLRLHGQNARPAGDQVPLFEATAPEGAGGES